MRGCVWRVERVCVSATRCEKKGACVQSTPFSRLDISAGGGVEASVGVVNGGMHVNNVVSCGMPARGDHSVLYVTCLCKHDLRGTWLQFGLEFEKCCVCKCFVGVGVGEWRGRSLPGVFGLYVILLIHAYTSRTHRWPRDPSPCPPSLPPLSHVFVSLSQRQRRRLCVLSFDVSEWRVSGCAGCG